MTAKKKGILIGVIAAAVVIILIVWRVIAGRGDDGRNIAYVETVQNLTGQSALGMVNKFSGVVEAQGTWSVNKNTDADVKQIYVEVGDEVKKGDELFEYDTDKYSQDLEQAQIDLERMNNEYQSTEDTLAQLQKQKKTASASEQANYTIQIEEQQLSLKDKALDIKMKQKDIEKLQDNIKNAKVTSGIDGVVKSINDGTGSDSSSSEDDNSFITVMQTGDYRIKGTVNETNIGELTVGANVIVHSRVNDDTWKGTISSIDTDNQETSNNNYYSYGDSSNTSARYPFYVNLVSSDGLMMGQHVYVELDEGQDSVQNTGSGIWMDEYLIDESDADHPFVWKEVNGRIRKQEVTLGDRNEELGQVLVTKGLALTDSIAIPDDSLQEGMKTAPMSEMPDDYGMTGAAAEEYDDSSVYGSTGAAETLEEGTEEEYTEGDGTADEDTLGEDTAEYGTADE